MIKVIINCDRCSEEIPDILSLYKVSLCGSESENIMKGHKDLCPKCAKALGLFLRGGIRG